MSYEGPFVIRPASDACRVEVWSDVPPSFQPKGWKADLRDEVAGAVQHMSCSPDQMLDAYYYSRDRIKADAENVLFYNIGTSAFQSAGSSAIRFTRVFADPPVAPGRDPRRVYLKYEIVSLEAPSQIWELLPAPLARWERVPLILPPRSWWPNSGTPAGLYWLSMKQAQPQLGEGRWDGFFALDLTLHGPNAVNLPDVIKPVVDGLVASFQSHDGPIADAALSKLKRQLGVSAPDDDVLRAWLSDSERAVLGAQKDLARPKGSALWNPRDHDCVLCRLRLAHERAGGWYLSGVLNGVVPVQNRKCRATTA